MDAFFIYAGHVTEIALIALCVGVLTFIPLGLPHRIFLALTAALIAMSLVMRVIIFNIICAPCDMQMESFVLWQEKIKLAETVNFIWFGIYIYGVLMKSYKKNARGKAQ